MAARRFFVESAEVIEKKMQQASKGKGFPGLKACYVPESCRGLVMGWIVCKVCCGLYKNAESHHRHVSTAHLNDIRCRVCWNAGKDLRFKNKSGFGTHFKIHCKGPRLQSFRAGQYSEVVPKITKDSSLSSVEAFSARFFEDYTNKELLQIFTSYCSFNSIRIGQQKTWEKPPVTCSTHVETSTDSEIMTDESMELDNSVACSDEESFGPTQNMETNECFEYLKGVQDLMLADTRPLLKNGIASFDFDRRMMELYDCRKETGELELISTEDNACIEKVHLFVWNLWRKNDELESIWRSSRVPTRMKPDAAVALIRYMYTGIYNGDLSIMAELLTNLPGLKRSSQISSDANNYLLRNLDVRFLSELWQDLSKGTCRINRETLVILTTLFVLSNPESAFHHRTGITNVDYEFLSCLIPSRLEETKLEFSSSMNDLEIMTYVGLSGHYLKMDHLQLCLFLYRWAFTRAVEHLNLETGSETQIHEISQYYLLQTLGSLTDMLDPNVFDLATWKTRQRTYSMATLDFIHSAFTCYIDITNPHSAMEQQQHKNLLRPIKPFESDTFDATHKKRTTENSTGGNTTKKLKMTAAITSGNVMEVVFDNPVRNRLRREFDFAGTSNVTFVAQGTIFKLHAFVLSMWSGAFTAETHVDKLSILKIPNLSATVAKKFFQSFYQGLDKSCLTSSEYDDILSLAVLYSAPCFIPPLIEQCRIKEPTTDRLVMLLEIERFMGESCNVDRILAKCRLNLPAVFASNGFIFVTSDETMKLLLQQPRKPNSELQTLGFLEKWVYIQTTKFDITLDPKTLWDKVTPFLKIGTLGLEDMMNIISKKIITHDYAIKVLYDR